MMYFRSVNDSVVVSINTVNEGTDGNITAEEYNTILHLFRNLPSGMVVHDNGDGTYSYVENPSPPDPDPDIDDDELLDILMGVSE